MTTIDIIKALEKIRDQIEGDTYTADNIQDLIVKLSKEKQKISIPLSDNDLQDLQAGETFDWTFDGVDVHLYQTNEDTE